MTDRLRIWRATAGGVLLAECDGYTTGLVAVHLMPFLERDGTRARIVALVVDETWRARQIGHRLLAAAEDYARAHDCVDMEITSSRSRRPAMTFYGRYGYRDVSSDKARFLKSLRPLGRGWDLNASQRRRLVGDVDDVAERYKLGMPTPI